MTAFYIYYTINVMEFNGKWTYGMGRLKKKLTHDASFFELSPYQKKKLLSAAVGDAYDISGRMGKYVACEKETGRPVWYIYVE